MLTQEKVKELFSYDPNTGEVRRKVSVARNAKEGALAGWKNSEGYLHVKIEKASYKLHRIIWLYVYGVWPTGVIDHINRIKDDNRIVNLRDATVQLNNINKGARKDSKTGVPNVTWRERDKSYQAACRRNGKQNYLGSYKNIDDALKAVEAFKAEIGRGMR
jgi:hypothetical protein